MAAVAPAARTLHAPPNPDYGQGATRRRVRLVGREGRVLAALCDPFHRMRCAVEHDGRRVLAVTGAMPRNPTTACPGAIAGLRQLVGLPLTAGPADLGGAPAVRRQCTHLFDLAMLALAHACRPAGPRELVALVPDETVAPVDAEVSVDGARVHRWRIANACLLAPAPLAGAPLLSGFSRWAGQAFAGDVLEAAVLLQRTWLVAQGRRYRLDQTGDRVLAANGFMLGACYAYQPERAATARYRPGATPD